MMKHVLFSILLALTGCTQTVEDPEPRIVYKDPGREPPPVTPPARPGFVNLDIAEDVMLLDLQNIQSRDERENTRYLVGCDRYNQTQDLAEFEQGINIAMNRLSDERFIYPVQAVGQAQCIFRINLEDYSLTQSEWRLIEQATLLDFVSQTTRNQTLQFLTQTRKPYIFAVDTIAMYEGDEVADRAGQVYYNLVDQPNNTQEFLLTQGINLQDEVDEERAVFSGFSQSQIALGKTRLIVVTESDNGYCMGTFDTALGGDDLFENPFNLEVTQAGGVLQSNKLFVHDAQEWICSLDNGLFGLWRLNNANDDAEVEAPTNIVSKNDARIDPSIRIGDCNSCHFTQVAIPFSDQIGQHIRNNSAFDANEKRLGEIFYNYDKISAIIDDINKRNRAALDELGITAQSDPLTGNVWEPFRAEMNAEQVAAFTFLTTEEFLERLEGTAVSSQVFGNLSGGGSVSLAVLSANFAQLVDELNLFEDVEL